MLKIGILLIGFLSPTVLLAVAVNPAVHFYKDPQSNFPSGEVNRRDLEKNWQQDQSIFSYLIQSGQKKHWIKADNLARDLHLSELVFSTRSHKTYRVLNVEGSHILGQAPQGLSPEWLPITELTPAPEDLGVALTLISTQLRDAPTWKSNSIMTLAAQSRLKILRLEDTWAQVQFESVGKVSGWVDLNNLLTKFDYAAFVSTNPSSEEKTWQPVLYREGTHLLAQDHSLIPLSKVTAIMTKGDLGISLVNDDAQKLLLRQNISILKTDAETWSVSRLIGHGDVYWKKAITPSENTEGRFPLAMSEETLTTDQLLKRELNSVSFHPQNPNLGIASGQGIFLTTDGKVWSKISHFKNQNLAVLIDEQSVIYVGSARSFDLGKTFSPFLKLESLAHLIEEKQKRPPNQMRIASLSTPRSGILQMEIETDLGRLRLASRKTAEVFSKWDFN